MFTLIENTISFDDTSLEDFFGGGTTISLTAKSIEQDPSPGWSDFGSLKTYYLSCLEAEIWFSAEETSCRYTECGAMRFFNELATVICALPMHGLDTMKFSGPDRTESWTLSRAGDRYTLQESRWTEALSVDREAFDESVWDAMRTLMRAYRQHFPDIPHITDYTHCLLVAGHPLFEGAKSR